MEAESSYHKPTPEWDYWTRLDRWKLQDAILLLLEFEPRAPDGKEIWDNRAFVIKRKLGGYPCIEPRFFKEPLSGIASNAKKYYEWASASYSAGKLRLISGDYRDKLWSKVDPAEWLAWAEKKSIAIPKPLRVLSGTGTQQPRSKWPWGDYETELLRKLAQAGTKFWQLYDPSDPSTAPTNKQVLEWLQGENVSKRVAEVMAQILRADGLPTGPRT